ncbi:chemotaxis response regulator protein-glutamate methylesterase [Paraliobacillus quinghaiensis]|uniref:Protein-glutamate methylesterase/protein-glutamine glutaminase n=1 Tax=Paraliobacillus quinghaiensis TaxID=470815 RepID=A0A917TFZ8_9BACI|nr:chemotaxis response regulator protein-glutamate methylesterase [Paraliobacillus quinghaiensis]GGM21498.1 chemotaxis response regulator protein-glutamate methylesterase [Paraliobacillus quinghaiensis]
MGIINVLVVDDSAFMRKMIAEILQSHPRINVIGTARNGQDALEKIAQLKPDVVTLDVEMPIMDGISTLREIMMHNPIPVIMLSSLTKEGANKTLESMELGAIDFITKPSGSISLNIQEKEAEIKTKVLHAVNAKAEKLTKTKPKKTIIAPFAASHIHKNENKDVIVGIGTSTGGPRALQQVITRLPKDIPAPIVIVQHMPAGFTKSLAKRLNSMSQLTVKEAEDQEILQKGTAYIAPGGYQFRVVRTIKGLQAKVAKEEPRNGHQPSVDVLFESLAKLKEEQVYAVMMTGMGADGANSLITLKREKSNTIIFSESKETCIVYGMPQAAEKTNLVDYVVRLPEISELLVSQIKARGE